MTPILETHVPHQYSVTVTQELDGSFTITYGAEIKRDLTYATACQEYGEAVFHALVCSGLIDTYVIRGYM